MFRELPLNPFMHVNMPRNELFVGTFANDVGPFLVSR